MKFLRLKYLFFSFDSAARGGRNPRHTSPPYIRHWLSFEILNNYHSFKSIMWLLTWNSVLILDLIEFYRYSKTHVLKKVQFLRCFFYVRKNKNAFWAHRVCPAVASVGILCIGIGTSYRQHSIINFNINSSYYFMATCFDNISVILRPTFSTKICSC